MGLTRSDSSSSQWLVPPALAAGDEMDGESECIRDQRRLRHLSSILIRNLTLNPRRDRLSSLLHSPNPVAPTTSRAQDDTDLLLRSSHANKRRSRASSSASVDNFNSSSGEARNIPAEWRREVERDEDAGSLAGARSGGDASLLRSRTRPRRTSAASVIIREEVEPPSPSAPPGLHPSSPLASTSSLPLETAESQPHPFISKIPSFRKRSTSRASANSAASAGTSASTSTIRQTPRLDELEPEGSGSFSPHPVTPYLPSTPTLPATGPRPFHAASSEAQLAKEKARREEILRRRLVDSFVSLELVHPPSSWPNPAEEATATGRRRAPTLSGSVRGRMVRSDSASAGIGLGVGTSGWTSPTKRPARSRTLSSPVTPSSKFSSPVEPVPAPTPFFVSTPATKTMHPTFTIDRDGFILPPPSSASSSTSPTPPCAAAGSIPTLDDEDTLQHWEGLREGRLLVKVWTKGGEKEVEGKGKGKEMEPSEEEWRLLLEWDVELDGLVSLGRDPAHFPSLPPNTLIFQLHSDEYFTAPLSSRRRPHSRSHSRRLETLGSLSDGDAEDGDSGDSDYSSEDEENEGGNMSDPGAGGTIALRGRRRGGSLRRELEEERREAAEEKRKRRALVEKSVRETRMVRLAPMEDVGKLVDLDRQVDGLRKEVGEMKKSIADLMFPEDQDGEEALEREKEEMRDKVEDLEAVREQMREELGEAREALANRRDALDSRRERLRAAKGLDEQRRDELELQRKEVAEDEQTCATIRLSSRNRRTQLITLLSHIFPIDPYESPSTSNSSSSTSSPLLFSILALPLPNSTYPPSALSSETLSSALGYTAQVVSTLAAYLAVPLHYPIKCLGSRSAVVDLISMMRGPRAFPLYPKGVDRYRFDYAVFLLNKNIEQLMYSQGLTVIDLRNTLPNLKSLILALSYDPSHSDFTALTLSAPPSCFVPPNPSPLSETSSSTADDSDEDSHSAEEGGEPRSSPPTSDETSNPIEHLGEEQEVSAPPTADDDDPPRSPASTVKAFSVRSSSPAPTVTSLRSTRSNGTANGKVSESTPPPPPTKPPAVDRSSSKSRSAGEKPKAVAAALKPKLNGRETLVAEEAKEVLLKGSAGPNGSASGKGKGSAGRSSGSRLASSLWSAVGYGES